MIADQVECNAAGMLGLSDTNRPTTRCWSFRPLVQHPSGLLFAQPHPECGVCTTCDCSSRLMLSPDRMSEPPDDDTRLCRVPDPARPSSSRSAPRSSSPSSRTARRQGGDLRRARLAPPPPPSPSPPPPKTRHRRPRERLQRRLGVQRRRRLADNYAYAYEDHEAVMSACTCPSTTRSATRRAAAARRRSRTCSRTALAIPRARSRMLRCTRTMECTMGHGPYRGASPAIVEFGADANTLENSAGANLVSCQYTVRATCASPRKDSLILTTNSPQTVVLP